jgi:acyl-CoA reductase-like NAD-dependent aldehyde dehydrogenase
MTTQNHSFIAGNWVQGTSEIENRNPSDTSDLIGMYSQASADQLDMAIDAACEAQNFGARRA